jgi:hypothetical protein
MEKVKKTLILLILLFGIFRFAATSSPTETPGQRSEQAAIVSEPIPVPVPSEPQLEQHIGEAIHVIKRLSSLLEKFVDFLVELFHFFLAALSWIDEWGSDSLDAFMGFLCLVGLFQSWVGMKLLSILSTFNK